MTNNAKPELDGNSGGCSSRMGGVYRLPDFPTVGTASLAEWLKRLESGRSRVPIPHATDLNTGTPVATLPGAWRYRVSVGTGWPGVSDWVR